MRRLLPLLALCLCIAIPTTARAEVVLFDNLMNASAGTHSIGGLAVEAAYFATDAHPYRLGSITLPLEQTLAGSAILDVYDASETYVATLTSPGTYPAGGLGPATFTTPGLDLAPSAAYWAVLHTTDGSQFAWSWTAESYGEGVGFTTVHAVSIDGGLNFTTSDTNPMQMQVTATRLDTPEPGTLALLAAGAGLAAQRRRRRAMS